jgi:acetylornithine/N-succinyldiaminopimelate aminotransferase
MKLFDVYPLNQIVIESAKGAYVYDDKGIEYLDMYGGHAVISIGHGHPHWVDRIQSQMGKISFYSNSLIIQQQEELSEILGRVSKKNDYQLFLINSGAEANENALKLASFHTGRKKIVAFKNGFHGRTSLAVACTDNPSIVSPVNQTENVIFLDLNDHQSLEDAFKKQGDQIAAVIIEGIQGVGGIRVATPEFLLQIRNLCDTYGSVYIADSVQCGYGRTGQFYAHDIAGVNADIYTMAKGMGNGYPIGAISIAPKFAPKHGMLGTTFGGNYLACVAAIAVLEVIEKDNLIENARVIGDLISSKLQTYDSLENVRGRGLMIGFDPKEEVKNLRSSLLEEHKIFTGNAKPNVIRLLPTLNLSEHEVNVFFDAIDKVLTHQAVSA